MSTGLQGQKIMYTTSFMEKVYRKILVWIRAKLLECLGWLCMTLHLSFPSMYQARYKSTFWKIKLLGLAEAWSPRVFSSLSLSPSPSLSGWSLGAWGLPAFTYLPRFLRPEREDKPTNISLFLSSIFLSSTFFPYLSLNQSPTLFLLQVSLDPAGGWTPAVHKAKSDNGSIKRKNSSSEW